MWVHKQLSANFIRLNIISVSPTVIPTSWPVFASYPTTVSSSASLHPHPLLTLLPLRTWPIRNGLRVREKPAARLAVCGKNKREQKCAQKVGLRGDEAGDTQQIDQRYDMVLLIPNPTILRELRGIRSDGHRKRVRRRVPFFASPVYCMTQCKNIPR